MIINITGQSGSGKTTLANELCKIIDKSINIDGDELRYLFDNKDYSEQGRRNNIQNAYNIAIFLESKGFTPIISLVSPYKDLRENLKQKAVYILEVYLHTSEIRGREKYHVSNYDKPENANLVIDTTNSYVSENAMNIYRLIDDSLPLHIFENDDDENNLITCTVKKKVIEYWVAETSEGKELEIRGISKNKLAEGAKLNGFFKSDEVPVQYNDGTYSHDITIESWFEVKNK